MMDEQVLPDRIENVILITVDCLRPDHLPFYGYHRDTTPNILRLTGRGIIVRKVYANAPFTLASIPSLMTSSYPLEGDPFYSLRDRPLPIYYLLKEKGFKTAGFNSNDLLSLIPGYKRGFDYYWIPREMEKPLNKNHFEEYKFKIITYLYRRLKGKKLFKFLDLLSKSTTIRDIIANILKDAIPYPYPSASIITKKAIEWIERNKSKPFFLWIHYMDTHNPYLAGEDLLKLRNLSHPLIEQELIKKSREYYIKRKKITMNNMLYDTLNSILFIYDKRIQKVDENIGKLIKRIRELNLANETLLILTSDHGQGFLEHGFYSHLAYFYNEILRVPLLITTLGEENNLLVKKGPYSLMDISPTILYALGEQSNVRYRGINIFKSKGKNRILSESIHGVDGEHVLFFKENESTGFMVSFSLVVNERWKYIARYDETGLISEELYDMISDPREIRDLSNNPSFSDLIVSIRKDLNSHLKEIEFSIGKLKLKYKILNMKRKLAKI